MALTTFARGVNRLEACAAVNEADRALHKIAALIALGRGNRTDSPSQRRAEIKSAFAKERGCCCGDATAYKKGGSGTFRGVDQNRK